MVATGLTIKPSNAFCVFDVYFVKVDWEANAAPVACCTKPFLARSASKNDNVCSRRAVLAFDFIGVGREAQSVQVVNLRSLAHLFLPFGDGSAIYIGSHQENFSLHGNLHICCTFTGLAPRAGLEPATN